MKIDVSFDNVRVYNIEKIDVVVNQKFDLTIADDVPTKTRWFVDNDPVIDMILSEDSSTATIRSSQTGLSTILIMDGSFAILKTLSINVVEDIKPIARKFEAVVGAPELKWPT